MNFWCLKGYLELLYIRSPFSPIEQLNKNRKCHETPATTPKKGHGAHEAVTDFMSRNANIKELWLFSNQTRNQAENCYNVMLDKEYMCILIYNFYVHTNVCRHLFHLLHLLIYRHMHVAVQKQNQRDTITINACVSCRLPPHRHLCSVKKYITTKTI